MCLLLFCCFFCSFLFVCLFVVVSCEFVDWFWIFVFVD